MKIYTNLHSDKPQKHRRQGYLLIHPTKLFLQPCQAQKATGWKVRDLDIQKIQRRICCRCAQTCMFDCGTPPLRIHIKLRIFIQQDPVLRIIILHAYQ
eukprot:746656-Hanusia_phi.AAC.5